MRAGSESCWMSIGKRSLIDCMETDDYTYSIGNGEVCIMEKEEIDYISHQCDEIDKIRLKIPITVVPDVSGDSMWRVDGMTESKVIAKILGKTLSNEGTLKFFNPDLAVLMKKLPSSVQILFFQ